GIAFRLYIEDNTSRYPPLPTNNNWISYEFGGGDPDPDPEWSSLGLITATNRLLWPYTHSRQLYRCPADRGMNLSPACRCLTVPMLQSGPATVTIQPPGVLRFRVTRNQSSVWRENGRVGFTTRNGISW